VPERERLQAAAMVLRRGAAPAALAQAAQDIYALLSDLTGVAEASQATDLVEPRRLPRGLALAPRDAARCVVDFVRTSRYLQGLEAAIAEAARRFGTPVEVLYAGCGPFAPLCLPLAQAWGPERVRFTLLDVHSRSLEAVARALERLGLGACVRRLVHADATAYRHQGVPPQVVVVEAMQRALEREPQAAITANLVPQLAPGGLLVPEQVTIDACLADPEELQPAGRRVELGRVLDLSRETAHLFSREGGPEPVVIEVPALAPRDPDRLMLRTAVTLFRGLRLGECESGLTHPAFRHELGHLRAGSRLEFRYALGPEPRLCCRRL
jgi:hypothetical protein